MQQSKPLLLFAEEPPKHTNMFFRQIVCLRRVIKGLFSWGFLRN